jgi:hydrogenase expression/formation protein HypE
MLGFDPLSVANEGKVIAIVGREEADRVLAVMRQNRYGADAVIAGVIQAESPGRVLLKTAIGSHRIVDVLLGEMLPRIC